MAARTSFVTCPVSAMLQLIGGKYKALILWHLVQGKKRYGALSRLISQATPKMLTQQLRELEADGLVTRTVYPVVPPKVEYALTAFGLSLKPVLDRMYAWGEGYLREQGIRINCGMEPPENMGG